MDVARRGQATKEIEIVAKKEGLPVEFVRSEVAAGRLVIPANPIHKGLDPIGIGVSTRCKINANIGNSAVLSNIGGELEKLKIALKYGADTVMDLSTGGDIGSILASVIKESPAPVGTVPIYQSAKLVDKIEDLSVDQLFSVIEAHGAMGVDFMTLHCGLLQSFIPLACKRHTGIVSRGGALLAKWMVYHDRENPLYENFDRVLDICEKYDVTISLGDGLRPGSLADASDQAQFAELEVLGELTKRAWQRNIQVMIEGPGHIPFNQIQMNVEKQVKICKGAPFYVLGPVVTDIAPGYDHITSAIGATMAAYHGASLLCYVTPKEHLGLPELEDVRQGVIAYKIAAHAADVARGRPGVRDRDDKISEARYQFDWEGQFRLALDPEKARQMSSSYLSKNAQKDGFSDYCSMCGPEFCPMKISGNLKGV